MPVFSFFLAVVVRGVTPLSHCFAVRRVGTQPLLSKEERERGGTGVR